MNYLFHLGVMFLSVGVDPCEPSLDARIELDVSSLTDEFGPGHIRILLRQQIHIG